MKTQLDSSNELPAVGTPGKTLTQRANGRASGFSLIEMIGVLALLAISAAMLLPVLTQTTDVALASQETSLMQNFASAMQLTIQRNHVIPNVTDWVSIVASELGMNSNAVAFNTRGQPRYLLVDANGFGNLTLPYVETSAGTPNPLTNSTPPRFIFLSSLGQAIPPTVVSNLFPTSADFNALWNCPAGTIPTNVPWSNPTWSGRPSDLTIQRLDLAYVFARLTLSNLDPTNATYSINGSTPLNLGAASSPSNLVSAYYLTATVLNLYMANTNLEASQVLNRDSSWVFSGGVWRNAPAPAPAASATNAVTGSGSNGGTTGTVSVPGCVDNDPGDCCHQFNCQSFCTNFSNPWTGCRPNDVCNDFTNYMCIYQQYAATGFTNRTCRTQLQNCCNQLNNDCGNLSGYNNW